MLAAMDRDSGPILFMIDLKDNARFQRGLSAILVISSISYFFLKIISHMPQVIRFHGY